MNVTATNFILNYWPWLLTVFLVLAAIIIFLIVFSKNKKKPVDNFDSFILLVGGIDNISSVTCNGSRLSLTLKNSDLVNNEEIKKIGVYSIIKLTTKTTFLVGEKAPLISEYIQKRINQ